MSGSGRPAARAGHAANAIHHEPTSRRDTAGVHNSSTSAMTSPFVGLRTREEYANAINSEATKAYLRAARHGFASLATVFAELCKVPGAAEALERFNCLHGYIDDKLGVLRGIQLKYRSVCLAVHMSLAADPIASIDVLEEFAYSLLIQDEKQEDRARLKCFADLGMGSLAADEALIKPYYNPGTTTNPDARVKPEEFIGAFMKVLRKKARREAMSFAEVYEALAENRGVAASELCLPRLERLPKGVGYWITVCSKAQAEAARRTNVLERQMIDALSAEVTVEVQERKSQMRNEAMQAAEAAWRKARTSGVGLIHHLQTQLGLADGDGKPFKQMTTIAVAAEAVVKLLVAKKRANPSQPLLHNIVAYAKHVTSATSEMRAGQPLSPQVQLPLAFVLTAMALQPYMPDDGELKISDEDLQLLERETRTDNTVVSADTGAARAALQPSSQAAATKTVVHSLVRDAMSQLWDKPLRHVLHQAIAARVCSATRTPSFDTFGFGSIEDVIDAVVDEADHDDAAAALHGDLPHSDVTFASAFTSALADGTEVPTAGNSQIIGFGNTIDASKLRGLVQAAVDASNSHDGRIDVRLVTRTIKRYFRVKDAVACLPALADPSSPAAHRWVQQIITADSNGDAASRGSASSIARGAVLETCALNITQVTSVGAECWGAEAAIASISRCAMLEDVATMTAWTDVFEPLLGDLGSFLAAHSDAIKARFLETAPGLFVRVADADLSTIPSARHALRSMDLPTAAAIIASMQSFGSAAAIDVTAGELKQVLLASMITDCDEIEAATTLISLLAHLPVTIQRTFGSRVIVPLLFDQLQLTTSSLTAVFEKVSTQNGRVDTVVVTSAKLAASLRTSLSFYLRCSASDGISTHHRQALQAVVVGSWDRSAMQRSADATAAPTAANATAAHAPQADGIATIAAAYAEESVEPDDSPIEEPAAGAEGDHHDGDAVHGHLIPPSLESAKREVEAINREWMSGPMDKAKQTALGLLSVVSGPLYDEAMHFLYEMVQNADDNHYASAGTVPELTFSLDVLTSNPAEAAAGSPSPGDECVALSVSNNEVGFRFKDIHSICMGAKSTKTDAGYIGKKGIGFKSVFKVTDRPEVHSGYVHFVLDKRPEPIGLGDRGYVCPQWMQRAGLPSRTPGTRFILPLVNSKRKVRTDVVTEAQISDALTNLARKPYVLLFMRKLRTLRLNLGKASAGTNSLPQTLEMTTIRGAPLQLSLEASTPSSVIPMQLAARIKTVVVRGDGAAGEVQHRWLVVEALIPFSAAPDRTAEAAEEGSSTKVELAFPIDVDMRTGLDSTGNIVSNRRTYHVFSFLPVVDYGLPFILQADWLTSTNRGGVQESLDWNQWLACRVLPELFAASYAAFVAVAQAAISESVVSGDAPGDKAESAAAAHLAALRAFLSFLPEASSSSDRQKLFPKAIDMVLERVRTLACIPTAEGTVVAPTQVIREPSGFAAGAAALSTSASGAGPSVASMLQAVGADARIIERAAGASLLHPELSLSDIVAQRIRIGKWSTASCVEVLKAVWEDKASSSNDLPAVKRFIASCELLWASRPSGKLQSLHEDLKGCDFVPLAEGGTVAVGSIGISYVDPQSTSNNVPILMQLASMLNRASGTRVQAVLHPDVTNQHLQQKPWLRSLLEQAIGCTPLSLDSIMKQAVIPTFQNATARAPQSPNQPLPSADALLIACFLVAQQWYIDRYVNNAPSQSDDRMMTTLRNAVVFVTADGSIARPKIRIAEQDFSSTASDGISTDVPSRYLHLPPAMMPSSSAKHAGDFGRLLSGNWHVLHSSYGSSNATPAAAANAEQEAGAVLSDHPKDPRVAFLHQLGVCASFHGVPVRKVDTANGASVPTSSQAAVQSLVPSQTMRAARKANERAHADVQSQELEATVTALIQQHEQACRRGDARAATQATEALDAIITELRMHADLSPQAIPAECPLRQFLCTTAWIPLLSAASDGIRQLAMPATLSAPLITVISTYGNHGDYATEALVQLLPVPSQIHRDAHDAYQRESLEAICHLLEVQTAPSGRVAVDIIRKLATAAEQSDSALQSLVARSSADTTITRPTAASAMGGDATGQFQAISDATVFANVGLLSQLYKLITADVMTVADAIEALPFFVPVAGWAMSRQRDMRAHVYGRFVTLAAGALIWDDGLQYLLRYHGVWGAAGILVYDESTVAADAIKQYQSSPRGLVSQWKRIMEGVTQRYDVLQALRVPSDAPDTATAINVDGDEGPESIDTSDHDAAAPRSTTQSVAAQLHSNPLEFARIVMKSLALNPSGPISRMLMEAAPDVPLLVPATPLIDLATLPAGAGHGGGGGISTASTAALAADDDSEPTTMKLLSVTPGHELTLILNDNPQLLAKMRTMYARLNPKAYERLWVIHLSPHARHSAGDVARFLSQALSIRAVSLSQQLVALDPISSGQGGIIFNTAPMITPAHVHVWAWACAAFQRHLYQAYSQVHEFLSALGAGSAISSVMSGDKPAVYAVEKGRLSIAYAAPTRMADGTAGPQIVIHEEPMEAYVHLSAESTPQSTGGQLKATLYADVAALTDVAMLPKICSAVVPALTKLVESELSARTSKRLVDVTEKALNHVLKGAGATGRYAASKDVNIGIVSVEAFLEDQDMGCLPADAPKWCVEEHRQPLPPPPVDASQLPGGAEAATVDDVDEEIAAEAAAMQARLQAAAAVTSTADPVADTAIGDTDDAAAAAAGRLSAAAAKEDERRKAEAEKRRAEGIEEDGTRDHAPGGGGYGGGFGGGTGPAAVAPGLGFPSNDDGDRPARSSGRDAMDGPSRDPTGDDGDRPARSSGRDAMDGPSRDPTGDDGTEPRTGPRPAAGRDEHDAVLHDGDGPGTFTRDGPAAAAGARRPNAETPGAHTFSEFFDLRPMRAISRTEVANGVPLVRSLAVPADFDELIATSVEELHESLVDLIATQPHSGIATAPATAGLAAEASPEARLAIGRAGERIVYHLLQRHCNELIDGGSDTKFSVEWTNQEHESGEAYDITVRDGDTIVRYIEVKATVTAGGGDSAVPLRLPISVNEIAACRDHGGRYEIFVVSGLLSNKVAIQRIPHPAKAIHDSSAQQPHSGAASVGLYLELAAS